MKALSECIDALDTAESGRFMHGLIRELYPICRSITGDGVRATLDAIGRHIALERTEVPTGTPVFDWEVPPEWNVREAWVRDPSGRKVIDFADHNLHLVSYSVPVHLHCSLAELRAHLHSDPDLPDRIPYRTSYYHRDWGFCLTHTQLESLPDGRYEVLIDSTLEPGSLTYAECVLPGASSEEFLLFAHVCHPSLCNDNLSGVALLVRLAMALRECRLKYTYRLLFAPATIGSISWLSRNEDRLGDIAGGLVVSLVGDGAPPAYKKSRRGNAVVDQAAACTLAALEGPSRMLEFEPWGYDERQFGSPGINLPVGRFTRSLNGEFPEYHTSADDLGFVSAGDLADSLVTVLRMIEAVEADAVYLNLFPKGEPQLGRRGLYARMGGSAKVPALQSALLWVLNLSDGRHSILDIVERSGLPVRTVREAADLALSGGLLRDLADAPRD